VLDQSTSIVFADPNYDNWYVNMLGFATSIVQAFPISPALTRVSIHYTTVALSITFYDFVIRIRS